MPARNGFLSNRALSEYQPMTSPLYAARSVEEHLFRAWICDLHNTSTTYLAVLCWELLHSKVWSNKVKADTFHVMFLFELLGYKWLCRFNSQHRALCARQLLRQSCIAGRLLVYVSCRCQTVIWFASVLIRAPSFLTSSFLDDVFQWEANL